MTRIVYVPEAGRWQLWVEGEQTRWFDTEQEAIMAQHTTAIQTYDTMHQDIRTAARALLQQLREMQIHRRANPQIAAAVAATEPGQVVPGGTMPREGYLTADLLFDSLEGFIGSTLIPGNEELGMPAISVEDAVYRMG